MTKQTRTLGPLRALVAAGAFAVAAGVAMAQAAPSVVYAKVATLQVRASESPSSRVVEEVRQGAALQVVGASKFRYEVMTPSGARGFVSRLQVAESAPTGGTSRLGGLVRDDRAPREMRTSSASRGLAADPAAPTGGATLPGRAVDKPAAATDAQPAPAPEADPAAAARLAEVRRMEERARAITEAEVDAFLREGGLAQ